MKYEKHGIYSYTLGAFPTIELLRKYPELTTNVYFHEKTVYTDDMNIILEICKKNSIPYTISSKKINSISNKENVFVMAEFKKFEDFLDIGQQIVLVNPSDMGNVGTIMRTALGFGYKNLILINPCADVFNPKVIRSSMGAIFSLNIKHYDSFEEYVKDNPEVRKYLFMLDGKNILQNMQLKDELNTESYALIFGNEATGLSPELKKYGTTVLIKHSDKIDSLNLSISIGVALYEFSKLH